MGVAGSGGRSPVLSLLFCDAGIRTAQSCSVGLTALFLSQELVYIVTVVWRCGTAGLAFLPKLTLSFSCAAFTVTVKAVKEGTFVP